MGKRLVSVRLQVLTRGTSAAKPGLAGRGDGGRVQYAVLAWAVLALTQNPNPETMLE